MDFNTYISNLRSKIYQDIKEFNKEDSSNKIKFHIFNDGNAEDVPTAYKTYITPNFGEGHNDTTGKIWEEEKEILSAHLGIASAIQHRCPLNEIHKNVNTTCMIDIREQEKEKFRQVLVNSEDSFFGDNIKSKHKENRMVRYGEYSPRNPNIVSSDKPVLDLGEYEEKRRLLLEKKKMEYQQQMTQENSLVRYGEYSPRNPTAVSLDKPVLGLGEYEEKRRMMMEQKKREYKQQMTQRSKKLEELEKELLETKAEENKQTKQQFLTEITKVVFTIYFRVLKSAPSSKLLSVTLEGLAKFAHCINLNFYHDLVNVLDHIIEGESIGYREQLLCVQTVFKILSGQGETLNIDPFRFYTHLYRNLLNIHAGRNYVDLPITLQTLDLALIQCRKRVSRQRLSAFTKRLCTICLQLLHNGSLSCLALAKLNKSLDVLLDPDTSFGEGVYFPELEEPEYCNANNSALWELTVLRRHYHPTVRKYAQHILLTFPASGEGSLPPELAKLSAKNLYKDFDSSEMAFCPPVPMPKKSQLKTRLHGNFHFKCDTFESYIREVL